MPVKRSQIDKSKMPKNLIVQPQLNGRSLPMSVGGSVGQFDWETEPRYQRNVGKGKVPLYKFNTSPDANLSKPGHWRRHGEHRWLRLERNKQGGRWEEGPDAEAEWEAMKANPALITEFWGQTDVGEGLTKAVLEGREFKQLPRLLDRYNTWRQISD